MIGLMRGKECSAHRGDDDGMKHVSTVAAAVLFAALASPVLAADADNGLKISQRWCASCHVVAPDQKSGSADVPTFADIARRTTESKPLAVFLATPHGKMPDMTLSQPEIADIIAYIRTLGPPRPTPQQERKAPERPKNG